MTPNSLINHLERYLYVPHETDTDFMNNFIKKRAVLILTGFLIPYVIDSTIKTKYRYHVFWGLTCDDRIKNCRLKRYGKPTRFQTYGENCVDLLIPLRETPDLRKTCHYNKKIIITHLYEFTKIQQYFSCICAKYFWMNFAIYDPYKWFHSFQTPVSKQ